jgi:GntR family transcriptional regulator
MTKGKKAGDGRPLYQKIADQLGERLEKTAPGTFLPSEPNLAKEMGVSRSTLREAMRLFEARGMLVRRRGLGTYVARPPQVIETGLEVLSSIESLAGRIGIELEPCDLSIVERSATEEEARQLGLKPGSTIVELARVILAEGRPVAYLVDCLPRQHMSPDEIGDSFQGSVLSLLIRRGEPTLARSVAEISAIPVEASIADGLGVHQGDVCLYLEARLLSEEGEVIDHSRSYFLPGTFRFNIVRRVQP